MRGLSNCLFFLIVFLFNSCGNIESNPPTSRVNGEIAIDNIDSMTSNRNFLFLGFWYGMSKTDYYDVLQSENERGNLILSTHLELAYQGTKIRGELFPDFSEENKLQIIRLNLGELVTKTDSKGKLTSFLSTNETINQAVTNLYKSKYGKPTYKKRKSPIGALDISNPLNIKRIPYDEHVYEWISDGRLIQLVHSRFTCNIGYFDYQAEVMKRQEFKDFKERETDSMEIKTIKNI